MKFWSDLSWREKCRIKSGQVNELDYLSGYSYRVKSKVKKGKRKKSQKTS